VATSWTSNSTGNDWSNTNGSFARSARTSNAFIVSMAGSENESGDQECLFSFASADSIFKTAERDDQHCRCVVEVTQMR
jgi:hypothetical protein